MAEDEVIVKFRADLEEMKSDLKKVKEDGKKGFDDVKKAVKGVGDEQKKTASQSGNLSKSFDLLQKRIIGAFSVGALINFTSKLVELESQLASVDRQAKAVFGSSLPQMRIEADKTANSIGLTKSQFLNASASMVNYLQNLGLTRAESIKVSNEMLKLGGNLQLVAGNGKDTKLVLDDLQRIISGNIKLSKEYGITINSSNKELIDYKVQIGEITESEGTRQKALEISNELLRDSSRVLENLNDELYETEKQARTSSTIYNEKMEEMARKTEGLKNLWIDIKLALVDSFNILAGFDEPKLNLTLTDRTESALNGSLEEALVLLEEVKKEYEAIFGDSKYQLVDLKTGKNVSNSQDVAEGERIKQELDLIKSIVQAKKDEVVENKELQKQRAEELLSSAKLNALKQQEEKKNQIKQQLEADAQKQRDEAIEKIKIENDLRTELSNGYLTSMDRLRMLNEIENLSADERIEKLKLEIQLRDKLFEQQNNIEKVDSIKRKEDPNAELSKVGQSDIVTSLELEKQTTDNLKQSYEDLFLVISDGYLSLAENMGASQIAIAGIQKAIATAKIILDWAQARNAINQEFAKGISIATTQAIVNPAQGFASLGAVGTAKASATAINNTNLALGLAGVASAAIPQFVGLSKKNKFAKGVEFLNGAGTETSDSIPAYLSKGERVVTAKKNKQYWEELSAIHNGYFDKLINEKYIMPSILSTLSGLSSGTTVGNAMAKWKGENIVMELYKGRLSERENADKIISVLKTKRHSKRTW